MGHLPIRRDKVIFLIFVGWDKELEPADSNAVHRAVYEKVPIVPKDDGGESEGLQITPKVLKLILLALVCVVVVFGAVLPCAVIAIIKIILRLRRRAPRRRHPK